VKEIMAGTAMPLFPPRLTHFPASMIDRLESEGESNVDSRVGKSQIDKPRAKSEMRK
jgi:hypothetical protein